MHRQLAADLFNETWDLMDKVDRTATEDDLMIHMAHASRYHWAVVGEPVHFARGDWQLARVYTLVGRAEQALHYATSSLQWCQEHSLEEFDRGFAYEAMARAYALQGDAVRRDEHLQLALQTAQLVSKTSDREWLIRNLESVKTLSIPAWE